MTDETFPYEIWADLDHWIEGPAASDLRAQWYMKYIRADHVDALLKAEREKALREAAMVASGCPLIIAPESVSQRVGAASVQQQVATQILALIEKDKNNG